MFAEEQGLVLAPYSFPVFERWAATSFDGKAMRFEPADALEVFAERGELPRLSVVEHDLAAFSGVEPDVEPLPEDALALRRLMVDLCIEQPAEAMKKSVGVRLGWAQKLGIAVCSTERERIEWDLAQLQSQLGMKVDTGTPDSLETLLTRARRRPFEATAMRVGDTIHLLNRSEPQAAAVEGRARVEVHRISARQPSTRASASGGRYVDGGVSAERSRSALAGRGPNARCRTRSMVRPPRRRALPKKRSTAPAPHAQAPRRMAF